MDRKEIEDRVKNFLLEEMEVEEDKLFDDARLKEDMGIDSLDIVDVVVCVQRKFGFKIQSEEMKQLLTLRDFCDYIDKKVNNK